MKRFNFIKKLLINLRCSSKQWWVDRSIETLTGGHSGVSYPDQEYNRDAVQGNWDLTKHLDSKLKKNFNFSYKDEYPEHWQEIKKLWDVRGNVAHGNVCTYQDSIIDGIESKKFFEPVQHCIDWLISLNK